MSDFDAIGNGGLTAAVTRAKSGVRTLLLERQIRQVVRRPASFAVASSLKSRCTS